MNKNIKNIVLIPARSGSKRIANKNIRPFFGKPILLHTVEIIRKSLFKNNIYVSTNSDYIKNICNRNNIFCDELRPKELSNDSASVVDVLSYEINRLNTFFPYIENIALILPCSPLLDSKDINKALKLYNIKKKKYIVQSVLKFRFNLDWLMFKKKNSTLKKVFSRDKIKNLNINKNYYYDSGNLTIFNIKHTKNIMLNLKNKLIGYEINYKNGIDIDYEDDWELAEIIFKSK